MSWIIPNKICFSLFFDTRLSSWAVKFYVACHPPRPCEVSLVFLIDVRSSLLGQLILLSQRSVARNSILNRWIPPLSKPSRTSCLWRSLVTRLFTSRFFFAQLFFFVQLFVYYVSGSWILYHYCHTNYSWYLCTYILPVTGPVLVYAF